MSNRSKPFSGKKKKEQLQLKKQIKNQKLKNEAKEELWDDKDTSNQIKPDKRSDRINLKSDWDVIGTNLINPKNNSDYQNDIVALDDSWRRASFDIIFGSKSSSLEIPIRPDWDYNLTREELEESENKYFQSWIKDTYEKVQDRKKLSFFEHNLEVWRQLWRVCEISNVLVIVADIRNPIVHLPPSFCKYITETLRKPLIIVLTKSDLVAPKLRDEWKKYINESFSNIKIHFVSTFDTLNEEGTKYQKRYVHATGIVELLVDLKLFSNNPKLEKQWDSVITAISSRIEGDQKTNTISSEGLKDDSLFTIGFIGQPNVGKSSLINSIFGRKVVSASRTPGHTKHFQTLHLSAGIRVCDSPGLVFPSIIDKNLQILCGLYNIAQVKDPYGPILYLSKRIDLFKKLNIPRSQDPNQPSSVFYLCEEYAKKCGFYTSKAGRPDTYRVANFTLRQVIDGKIVISWVPPGYETALDQDFDVSYPENGKIYSENESTEDEVEGSDEEEELEELDDIKNFESKCRFSVFNELLE